MWWDPPVLKTNEGGASGRHHALILDLAITRNPSIILFYAALLPQFADPSTLSTADTALTVTLIVIFLLVIVAGYIVMPHFARNCLTDAGARVANRRVSVLMGTSAVALKPMKPYG